MPVLRAAFLRVCPAAEGGGCGAGKSDPAHQHSGFAKEHFDHAEVLVVIIAGILSHPFGGNDYLHDTGLDHGARAIHTGHDFHINGAAFGGSAGPGGVADCIALGVFDPQVFGRTHQTLRHVVADPARERVITGGADFVVGPNDDAADL